MSFGGICKNCPGYKKCNDKPSPAAPIELYCVLCEGRGCRKCETWELIKYSKLFEKGLPPISGGVLDQAKNFIDGCNFIFSESEYWKKKMGII